MPSIVNPSSPETIFNATLGTKSPTPPIANQTIKIDSNIPLIALNKLLNLINWLNSHTTQLPLRLTITVKNYIETQLNYHQAAIINRQDHTNPDWENCKTAFKKLTSDLPSLMPNMVWVPTAWAPHNPLNAPSLYTTFNVEQPHYIECKGQLLECKKDLNLKDMAFNILPSTKPQNLPKKSNSVLSLAHLLIAHIEAYPGSTIILSEKNCSYPQELSQYLYAYATLYQQIDSTLKLEFQLQWNTGKLIAEPKEHAIQHKIQEIMACEHLPDFETLQLVNPTLEEQQRMAPGLR